MMNEIIEWLMPFMPLIKGFSAIGVVCLALAFMFGCAKVLFKSIIRFKAFCGEHSRNFKANLKSDLDRLSDRMADRIGKGITVTVEMPVQKEFTISGEDLDMTFAEPIPVEEDTIEVEGNPVNLTFDELKARLDEIRTEDFQPAPFKRNIIQ